MKRVTDSPLHIALAFPIGLAHLQPLVRGIADYAREHCSWLFTTNPETVTMPIQTLRGWRGAGAIALILNNADIRAARELEMKVVTFSGAMRDPGVPRVMANNRLIGQLAAEHLLECGFPSFGYYGLHSVRYAHVRGEGYIHRLGESGRAASIHLARNSLGASHPWRDEIQKLEHWLGAIEGPVGIFAANDMRARMVIDACQRLGRRVPEDVGVIGVDNDQVTCEFSDPPLSSIDCNWYKIGVETAAAMDALLHDRPIEKEKLIDPIGVIKRRSSDVLIVEHAGVAQAIEYVREHLHEVFGIDTLLRETANSRRSLEQGFKRTLGCTPHEYVSRERIAKAKLLLAERKKIKLSIIASACGFPDARRLRIVFERYEGMTPAQYRTMRLEGYRATTPVVVESSHAREGDRTPVTSSA